MLIEKKKKWDARSIKLAGPHFSTLFPHSWGDFALYQASGMLHLDDMGIKNPENHLEENTPTQYVPAEDLRFFSRIGENEHSQCQGGLSDIR